MSLMRKALEIARTFVGVKEEPPRSNRGPEIDIFNEFAGTDRGAPWCASFVYFCISTAAEELGVKNPFADMKLKAYTPSYKLWGEEHDAFTPKKYEPGSLFLLFYPRLKRVGHVGFIKEVSGGVVHTIEGNTDARGSRTGGGVFERTRKKRGLHRIIQYGDPEWLTAMKFLYKYCKDDDGEGGALEHFNVVRRYMPDRR